MKNQPDQKLGQKIHKVITNIDVFGQPARFVVDGQQLQRSYFGGLMTLLISVVMILYTSDAALTFFEKKKYTFQETQEFLANPPMLQLSSSKFMLAIGISDPLITSTNQVFSYNMVASVFNKTQNGTRIIEQSIPLRLCQSSDFPDLEESFTINGIGNLLCPEADNFTISGTFTSSIYQFIKINVTDCVNNTYANSNTTTNTSNGLSSGIACGTPEFIENYISTSNKIRIDMYFINNIIHPADPNQPLGRFLDNLNWILTPKNLAKSSDVFIKEVDIITKDNILGLNQQMIQGYLYHNEDLEQVGSSNGQNKEYLAIHLRKSPYSIIYTRQFETIVETLASIGGIWNVFYLVLGAIAGHYNRMIFGLNLANHLYDFEVLENHKDDLLKKKNMTQKPKFPLSPSMEPLEGGDIDIQLNEKVKDKGDIIPSLREDEKRTNYLQGLFRNFKKKKGNLIYTFSDLIRLMLFGFKKSNHIKNILLQKASKQISHEIDIANILKRLREVEKLKHVVFDKAQLATFNFTPRPIIHTKESITRKSFLVMKSFDTDSIDGYIDAYQYFKILKEHETRINSKILNLIDQDTLEFFSKLEKFSVSHEISSAMSTHRIDFTV